MTPGQSQARSSYVIGYRDKALAYPARVGAMAGTPSRIGRNGSGTIERIRLAAGGSEIRTCMGLFLSSGRLWLFVGSLFGAGKPFFVPSPAIRFAERAEGVKGPKW